MIYNYDKILNCEEHEKFELNITNRNPMLDKCFWTSCCCSAELLKGYKQPLFALEPIVHVVSLNYRCNYTNTLFGVNIVFNKGIYIFNLRTEINLDIKICSYKELQEILPFLNKLSEKNLEENLIFS